MRLHMFGKLAQTAADADHDGRTVLAGRHFVRSPLSSIWVVQLDNLREGFVAFREPVHALFKASFASGD